MTNRILTPLILSIFFLFLGCKNSTPEHQTAGNSDTVFVKIADEFINGYLEWRPQMGTYLGLHEYDGRITDYSQASIDSELSRLKMYEQKLVAFPADSLSTQMNVDYRILLSAIRREMLSFEGMNIYKANPMTYASALDLNIYVMKDFAPLGERMRHIIKMQEKSHSILSAARENLNDSIGRPLIETAIQIAKGSASFMEKEMSDALKSVANDSLQKEFEKTNRETVKELRDFATYLQKEKLPKAHNRYAIGKDNYEKMLLYNEMVDASSEEILQMGMDELKREQALFAEVAKKIDPNKKPIEVFNTLKGEHSKAENLIIDARKNLESIRQFLIDKKIITVPSEVRVSLVETLPFARSTSTASMDTPGPFEKKATQAYYYITPVEEDWTPKQKEQWLSQFSYYVTDIISVHEAYPGHYVQFLHLNASKATKIQKIFGSYAFVEGWAHYTEKMMIEEGFGARDSLTAAKYHLAQLDESLVRLCRLYVSIKTHCDGMTVEEATKFFEQNAYYEHQMAHHEAVRGTYDPGYLSYTLGKLHILRLREEYKKMKGESFSLQEFHDNLLSHGMPPIQMLREIMLKK